MLEPVTPSLALGDQRLETLDYRRINPGRVNGPRRDPGNLGLGVTGELERLQGSLAPTGVPQAGGPQA